jgi:hypothetical protein
MVLARFASVSDAGITSSCLFILLVCSYRPHERCPGTSNVGVDNLAHSLKVGDVKLSRIEDRVSNTEEPSGVP